MAEGRPDFRKLRAIDWAIGVGCVLVAFVALYFVKASLNLPVPEFVVSGIAGALGVVVWFAFLNRKKS
jgi:hypothetical protein